MKRIVTAVALVLIGSACGGSSPPPLEATKNVALSAEADSTLGYTVPSDGWSFRNYRADASTTFSAVDAIALFGDEAVCVEASGDCTPTPAAAEWIAMVAESMGYGSCEGMTVSSLDRFLAGAAPPSGTLDLTPEVFRRISQLFATQYLSKVIDATKPWRRASVAEIFDELVASLADPGHEHYTLGVYAKGGGHSVVPYAVDRLEGGRAVIYVYDPNWPGLNRYVEVDTDSNRWRFSYQGADPETDPGAWTGGGGSLDLQPLSSREAPHEEAFKGSAVGRRVLLTVTSDDRNWAITAGGTTIRGEDVLPGEDTVLAVIRAGTFGATTTLIEVPEVDYETITVEAEAQISVTAQAPTGTITVRTGKQAIIQFKVDEEVLGVDISADAEAEARIATRSEHVVIETADELGTTVEVTDLQTTVEFINDDGEVVEEVIIEAGEDRIDIQVTVEDLEEGVVEVEVEVVQPQTVGEEAREGVLLLGEDGVTATTTTSTTPPETTTTSTTPPETTTTSTTPPETTTTTTSTTPPETTTTTSTTPPETTTTTTSTTPPETTTTSTTPPETTTTSTTPPETTTTTTTSTTPPETTTTTTSTTPPETEPGTPSGLSATAGVGQVDLDWAAPTDDGGSSIIDYVVEYSSDSGTTWTTFSDGTSTTASTTVTGLSAGITYSFRVAAVNSIGAGNGSSTTTATTATTPAAPSGLGAIAATSAATVDLAWTVPTDDGGSSIIDYVVEYSSDSGTTWTTFSDGTSTTASTTVTSLSWTTTYTLRVSAVNAVGTGNASNVASATTVATTPGIPTGLSGIRGYQQVALTWTVPTDDGGSSIIDYVVEYSSDSGTTWTTFSDGTSTTASTTVTSLNDETTYSFRVSATNGVGTSSPSDAVSATTAALPDAPTGLSATPTPGVGYSLDLSWTAANDNGSAVTGYEIRWRFVGDSTWWLADAAYLTRDSMTDTTVSLGSLWSVSNVHELQVAATNQVGTGEYSSTATATPTS